MKKTFTDEEILKALEVCLCNSSTKADCACFCPVFNKEKFRCGFKNGKRELYERVIDIIAQNKQNDNSEKE